MRSIALPAAEFGDGGQVATANSRREILRARDNGKAPAVQVLEMDSRYYTVVGTTLAHGRTVSALAFELVPTLLYEGPPPRGRDFRGLRVTWSGQEYVLDNQVELQAPAEETAPAELPPVPVELPARRRRKTEVKAMVAEVAGEIAAARERVEAEHAAGPAGIIYGPGNTPISISRAAVEAAAAPEPVRSHRCAGCTTPVEAHVIWCPRCEAIKDAGGNPCDPEPEASGCMPPLEEYDPTRDPWPKDEPELFPDAEPVCVTCGVALVRGSKGNWSPGSARSDGGPANRCLTCLGTGFPRELAATRAARAAGDVPAPAAPVKVAAAATQEPAGPPLATEAAHDSPPTAEAFPGAGEVVSDEWLVVGGDGSGLVTGHSSLAPSPAPIFCHRCFVLLTEDDAGSPNWNITANDAQGIPPETCDRCRADILSERAAAAVPRCGDCGVRVPRAGLKCERCNNAATAQTAAAAGQVLQLRTDQIAANPLNPRQEFDREKLEELAASIKVHGLLQPLVVYRSQAGRIPWTVLAGERRLRACLIAGLDTVPALVRDVADEKDAMALALVENLQRDDLKPIETARAYRSLTTLGWTQKQIGETVGLSQSGVANCLRLLELPEEVQAMLADGRLSAAHGRTLARFWKWPELCAEMARRAAEHGTTTTQLEQMRVPFADEIVANRPALLVNLVYYRWHFSTEKACKECPFGARLSTAKRSPGVADDYPGHWYCANPTHAHELDAAAQEENRRHAAEQAAARAAAKAQALAAGRRTNGAAPPSSLVEAGAKGGAIDRAEGFGRPPGPLPPAAEVLAPDAIQIPRLRDLRYSDYETLDRQAPAGCSKACECRGEARDDSGRVVTICTKPRRLAILKGKQRRTEEAGRGETAQEAYQRALAAIGADGSGLTRLGSRPLAPVINAVAVFVSQKVGDSAVQAAVTEMGLAGHFGDQDLAQWRFGDRDPLETLAALDVGRLAELGVRLVMSMDRSQAIAWAGHKPALLAWLAGGEAETALPAGVGRCRKCQVEAAKEDDGEVWALPDLCTACADALFDAGVIDEDGDALPAKPCRRCEEAIGAERLTCEWCGAAQEEGTDGETEAREAGHEASAAAV